MSNAIQSCPLADPPPLDPCEALRKKIGELIHRNKREQGGDGTHGLIHRFPEQIDGQNGPGTTSWDNHEQEIKNQQKALRKKLREWRKNRCGPPPPGAWHWATRPVPRPSQWKGGEDAARKTLETAGKVVAVGGAAYLAYRVIRFLPSLLPPLWPSIPANLAIP